MKKVLIITFSYPPYNYGLRADSINKYIKNEGWDADVVAIRGEYNGSKTELQDIHYIGHSSDYIGNSSIVSKRNVLNSLYYFFRPDKSAAGSNYHEAKSKCEELIQQSHYDIILATSCNVLFVFTIASELSVKYKIPWVADVRDIDEQFGIRYNIFTLGYINFLRTIIRRNQLLKRASRIVTISSWHAAFLEKKLKRKISLIYNGYDPNRFPIRTFEEMQSTDKFNICHFGTVGDDHMKGIELLCTSMETMIREKIVNNDIRLIFVGNSHNRVKKSFKDNNPDLVQFREPISIDLISDKMLDVSLLVAFTNQKYRGVMGTKIYEYMTSKKPIICIPDTSEAISAILKETKSGISISDPAELINYISLQYNSWKSSGFTYVESKNEIIKNYSRQKQAHQFADLFESLLQNKV